MAHVNGQKECNKLANHMYKDICQPILDVVIKANRLFGHSYCWMHGDIHPTAMAVAFPALLQKLWLLRVLKDRKEKKNSTCI